MQVDWKAGYTYRFRLQYLGDNWYRNTVTELQTGRQIDLGSIRALQPGIVDGGVWADYLDWNDRHYNWDGAPDAAMRWSDLTLNTGETVSFWLKSPDATENFSLSPDKKTVTLETYAGRSQQLPLLNRGTNRCMGLLSGEVKSVTCPSSLDARPPNRNLTWTFTHVGNDAASQIHAYNACLMSDTVGGSVYATSPCGSKAASPSIESSWIDNLAGDGTIRPAAAPNKCLTFASDRFSVVPCIGSMNQKWSQTDDYTKAYWQLEDASTRFGNEFRFKAELSRPASQASRTSIGVTLHVDARDVKPSRLRVTWDGGTHWHDVPVDNGYVSLPAGARTLDIAAEIPTLLQCTAQRQTGQLSLQEFAQGDFKVMPEAWTANGTLDNPSVGSACLPPWGH